MEEGSPNCFVFFYKAYNTLAQNWLSMNGNQWTDCHWGSGPGFPTNQPCKFEQFI